VMYACTSSLLVDFLCTHHIVSSNLFSVLGKYLPVLSAASIA
jgi:hypothetical protein